MIGPISCKCSVWSLNARSFWKDELHVKVERSILLYKFIVLDMEFCGIKKYYEESDLQAK
jgi:hypothetical protein